MNRGQRIGRNLSFLILSGAFLTLTSCAGFLGGGMDIAAFSRAAAEQTYTQALSSGVGSERKEDSGSLNLPKCREIALANNLSLHMAKLEEINRSHISMADWSKMLPHVILAAKFDQGDNVLFSDLPGDAYWSEFYARSAWRVFLEARWSPTDVALAYYTARNASNRALQSVYEKARLGQKIVEGVEVSFFRLLTVQECLPLAKTLVSLRSDITNRMDRLVRERLVSQDDYEKALNDEMRAQYLDAELKVELERQASALATYMGRSRRAAGEPLFLAVKGSLSCPEADEAPRDPELTALRNRPEIVALGLKQQESSNEFRKSVLKNFPRLSLFWRYLKEPYHDHRRRDGQQAGLLLYVDLVDSLSQIKETQISSNQRLRSQLELSAITLAVASQAGVAAKKFQIAREKAALRAKAAVAAERVMRAAEQRAQGSNLSEIAQIKARAELTGEKIELLKALGDANVCLAELRSALGVNYAAPLH
uniref:TolC family protein n=1 Tax=Desulfomonile tiedjei TaxID=2358 RepID=A0A7C4ESW2_9BACT